MMLPRANKQEIDAFKAFKCSYVNEKGTKKGCWAAWCDQQGPAYRYKYGEDEKDWAAEGVVIYYKPNGKPSHGMTQKQMFKRISHAMNDYYRANAAPVSVPRGTKGAALPQRVDLTEVDNETWANSKEKTIINLATIKSALSENEQEVVKLRLMGYSLVEIARIMHVAVKTVEGYLTAINKTCKEVHNA